jgi:hypothetical protein
MPATDCPPTRAVRVYRPGSRGLPSRTSRKVGRRGDDEATIRSTSSRENRAANAPGSAPTRWSGVVVQ